jgi:tRNA/tmRNA/rRNA uracil-C5-methylase (TrmA/RlmC/RlmD family)
MRPGDEITIQPAELVAGGAAMARVDGLPVFTIGVFPGDKAIVRITEAKKGFARAELLRLLAPSPLRRAAPCPVAGECGGCDWTALRLDAQLDAKKRILTESLRRIGKFDPSSLPEIAVHASPLNYRLRSRLHRDGDATGFYALRSNRVVPLPPECEVVGTETARVIPNATRPPEPSLSLGMTIWEIDGRLITDDREIAMKVDRYTYALSTRSFFQVNRHLLSTLLHLVIRNAERAKRRDVAIDLYAGVGFFSLPLSERFERLIAVEGSPGSSAFARRNLPGNATVLDAAVEDALGNLPPADLIFLDPPRAGARREVIERVAERARQVICYLSCDPVTFARDANRLRASGWRLLSLDLIDLFPNTHHVETLGSFERVR